MDVTHLLTIYRYFIDTHGSIILSEIWKASRNKSPFWDLIETIWNRKDKGTREIGAQCDLMMEFFLYAVNADLKSPRSELGMFADFCGVDDINDWFPHLHLPMNMFRSRLLVSEDDHVSSWVSLVHSTN